MYVFLFAVFMYNVCISFSNICLTIIKATDHKESSKRVFNMLTTYLGPQIATDDKKHCKASLQIRLKKQERFNKK